MKWFYFESDRGCGIRDYRNHESALKGIAREVGEGYVTVVREATERDIAWVRGMGGYIPLVPPNKRCTRLGGVCGI